MPSIAIIGAGCSGLSAIKRLLDEGLTDLICFEKNDRLGGNWVYTADAGHSSVCETTHIISSKAMSQFEDFPMPADYPDYPSHGQILAYFEDYARTFGLGKYIRFGVAVEKALPTPDGRWQLNLSDGSESAFDCLVVANGHHAAPRHPEWAKQFTGAYYHAHDFKNNRPFAGKRVLVVGAGNSGCDCAVECSRVAEQVDISVRSPQYIVPKFFMGKPTDTFARNMQWLPRSVQNILQQLSLRIQVGRYRDYGLPEPDFPPTKSHPTVNGELLEKIRHGKVHPRPGIARIEGRQVFFSDGASAIYDALIAATGYKIRFPFFDRALIDWEDATNIPLYMRVFHPDLPNLYFIGLVQPQGCVWPLSEAQSRLVGRVIAGKIQLPADWREQAYREGAAIERDFKPHPRHAVEVHYLPYLRTLKKAAIG